MRENWFEQVNKIMNLNAKPTTTTTIITKKKKL